MKKDNFNTLSDRLLYAIELTGTKKADLARSINVQPQTIQHLCNGGVQSSRFTFELATVLGLSTRWLATGEGEAFLADDPKYNLFKDYKKIPILNTEQLIRTAKNDEISDSDAIEWTALKTEEFDVFCVTMSDASMHPIFYPNAQIFFKKINLSTQEKIENSDVVIAYLPHFNSILIREIFIENNNTYYLSPRNKNLFKEVKMTDEMIIFGRAIECHFAVGGK